MTPVDFKSSLKALLNGKSICCILDNTQYFYSDNILINDYDECISIREILEGQWYILKK